MIVKGLIECDAAGGLAPTDRGRAVRRALLPDHETERRATRALAMLVGAPADLDVVN